MCCVGVCVCVKQAGPNKSSSMTSLTKSPAPSASKSPAPSASKSPPPSKPSTPGGSKPGTSQSARAVTGQEAAQNWLLSAKAEAAETDGRADSRVSVSTAILLFNKPLS